MEKKRDGIRGKNEKNRRLLSVDRGKGQLKSRISLLSRKKNLQNRE